MRIKQKNIEILYKNGQDILLSPNMQAQKLNIHHGTFNVFEHCVNVAYMSIYISNTLHIKPNHRALVRGALLYDYFLYDWHIPEPSHRLHGFNHAKTALRNAGRDFTLSDIEKDIIKKHMFPLNLSFPKNKESWIVLIADKFCALCETLSFSPFDTTAIINMGGQLYVIDA